ncbi:Zn-ribbon domain-containing OB-fold protein [Polaromonas sp.]|uniref:Zn-ribbon domain-containing OB-fold protein n=1 Tax=Polaromonas sp. TaxID=1869339 RepID=UPI00352AA75B
MQPTLRSVAHGEAPPAEESFETFIGRGELRVPSLVATGQILHFATRVPPADVEWVPARGTATLSSFTVMWKAYREGMKVPYNVAWVELDEGPRLISTVVLEPSDRLVIGMPLQALFRDGLLVFIHRPTQARTP